MIFFIIVLRLIAKAVSRLIVGLTLALLLAGCGLGTPTPFTVGKTNPATATVRPEPTATIVNRTVPTKGLLLPPTLSPVVPTSTPLPPTPTPVALPGGELILWEGLTPAQGSVLSSSLELFQKLYPEVQFNLRHLETETIGGQLSEATKDTPNLIIAPAERAGEWQKSKLILAVEPITGKPFLDNFEPNILQGLKIDNTAWGIPFDAGRTSLLFFNKKLIAADKIPDSWEALTSYVRANPIKKGEFYPFAADLYNPSLLLAFFGAFGGKTLFEQNNQPRLNNEPMQKALQFTQDAVFKNKVVPADPNYLQMQLLFRTGQLAMIIADSENLTEYQKPEWNNRLNLGIARLPQLQGQMLTPPSSGLAYFIGSGTASDGPKLAAVRAFLSFMAQPEQQRLLPGLLRLLPPTRAGLNDPVVKDDPLLSAMAAQFETARAVSPTPEFGVVVDAMRVPLSSVVASRASPAEGVAAMQEVALKKLKK